MMAEEWLEQIEIILNTLMVKEDEIRILLATYQVAGEARRWWLLESESHLDTTKTWKQFKELFFAKYFPPVVRETKWGNSWL